MLKISPLEIHLREWTATDFKAQRDASEKMRRLGQSAGQNSNRFKARRIALKRLAEAEEQERLAKALEDPIAARAYAHLLTTDDEFAEKALPTLHHIRSLKAGQWPITRLTLSLLGSAYFQIYSRLAEEPRKAMGLLIHAALQHLPDGKAGGLAKWKSHATTLFAEDAPVRVVNDAMDAELDLDNHLDAIGLGGHDRSDFVFACRRVYYITQLEVLEVGAEHPVLEELTKPSVHNAIYKGSELIGHRALEILIDRTPASGPSDTWRRAVLSIAGDPRVGKSNEAYKRWWQLLGDRRARKVVGWLSRLDLGIFLEVLESSARAKGQADIQRMYPPRKVFMEGLLEQGLVVQSRLFLSGDAASFLRRQYKKEDLPEYANIRTGETSMIYLELVNGLHMIEGTHSFKLKIINRLPNRPDITNYGKRNYTDSELRKDVLTNYILESQDKIRRFDYGTDFIEEIHRNISWQAQAIALLKRNKVPCDASKMLSPLDYKTFKATQPSALWT